MPGIATNIGVFVDAIDQDYQQQILRGINDEAHILGVKVICFVGGLLHSTRQYQRNLNFAYDLCSTRVVDGLVVLSGTIANECGMERLSEYCSRFSPLPVCSIGGNLTDSVEVAVDNSAGIRQALSALAQTYGCRRIAFIQGPHGNDEARERFAVYRDAVEDLRLANDSDLVVAGDFLEPSGARAVRTLLDDRRQSFDAIVCASDLMAMGAMQELAKRRVPVPAKVAVVGFDDIEGARFTSPPLATVRQPLYEQGRRSLREVVARLSEKNLPGRVFLSASFVPRESCGAGSSSHLASGQAGQRSDPELPDELRFEEAYRRIQPRILADIRKAIAEAGFPCEPGLPDTLLVQASTDIQGRRRGLLQGQSFVAFLQSIVASQKPTSTQDVSEWQEVVTVMRRHLGACLKQDPKWRRSAEEMWHQARIAISHIAERNQAIRWQDESVQFGTVRRAGTALLNASSLTELGQTLSAALQALHLPGCFVAQRREGTEEYRGLLACRSGQVEVRLDGAFSHERIGPQSFFETANRTTNLLEPLVFRQQVLGYAIFEMGPERGRVYAALRDYLAAAIASLPADEEHSETARPEEEREQAQSADE